MMNIVAAEKSPSDSADPAVGETFLKKHLVHLEAHFSRQHQEAVRYVGRIACGSVSCASREGCFYALSRRRLVVKS
jgi:hypothetical protein